MPSRPSRLASCQNEEVQRGAFHPLEDQRHFSPRGSHEGSVEDHLRWSCVKTLPERLKLGEGVMCMYVHIYYTSNLLIQIYSKYKSYTWTSSIYIYNYIIHTHTVDWSYMLLLGASSSHPQPVLPRGDVGMPCNPQEPQLLKHECFGSLIITISEHAKTCYMQSSDELWGLVQNQIINY